MNCSTLVMIVAVVCLQSLTSGIFIVSFLYLCVGNIVRFLIILLTIPPDIVEISVRMKRFRMLEAGETIEQMLNIFLFRGHTTIYHKSVPL